MMIIKNAKWLKIGLFGIFLIFNMAQGACNDSPGTSCTIQVSARVEQGCLMNDVIVRSAEDIGQLGTLNFGTFHTSDSGIKEAVFSQTANFNLKCTPGTTVSMSIDAGENESRRMKHRDQYIPYRLFKDAGRLQEIGIDQNIALPFDSTGNVAISFYGEAALEANMGAGVYQDTLIVTFSY
ncbi:Csu type fimbrial protein [Ignatzschineria sp. LJL83]